MKFPSYFDNETAAAVLNLAMKSYRRIFNLPPYAAETKIDVNSERNYIKSTSVSFSYKLKFERDIVRGIGRQSCWKEEISEENGNIVFTRNNLTTITLERRSRRFVFTTRDNPHLSVIQTVIAAYLFGNKSMSEDESFIDQSEANEDYMPKVSENS